MADIDIKIVHDLIKEVREDQKDQGQTLAKQSVILEHLDRDIKTIKKDVAQNTKDLSHHIARTDEVQNLNADNKIRIDDLESRLKALEEPVKAKEWLKKHIVSLLSILTAIASLAALIIKSFN